MTATKRWNLRVTNDQTGEVWVIADTRAKAEKDLAKKLAAWDLTEGEATVEWAEAEE
jgi:hypothetical protein